MLSDVLRHFPAHTHPLSLVHDPDHILADEELLSSLAERGFNLVYGDESVLLHLGPQQAQPFSPNQPLIIVTSRSLNELPYTLWQQGQKISLALHTLFPYYAYPVLQTLSPDQRWQLSQQPPPAKPLARNATIDALLQKLFAVDWDSLKTKAGLIAWLNRYHQEEPMPTIMAEHLVEKFRLIQPEFREWPLEIWLKDAHAFQSFVNSQWITYVQEKSGQSIAEPLQAAYQLSFEDDRMLQGTLPGLVESGTLTPVPLPTRMGLPNWAQVGVRSSPGVYARRRVEELLNQLKSQTANLDQLRWSQWQAIAQTWAELTTWRFHPEAFIDETQQQAIDAQIGTFDQTFWAWLSSKYAPLAVQKLPQPHHLHHVPHLMASKQRQGQHSRVALLVMDGLSLANWQLIRRQWQEQKVKWAWQETSVMAQIPTLTAISRQALFRGAPPATFAETLTHNKKEATHWNTFWQREADLPAERCAFERVYLDRETEFPKAVFSSRIQALALIYNGIDDMVHGASQGLRDVFASLRVWLDSEGYTRLTNLIAELLDGGYTVYLTSDHGHCEAWGMGQPAEGLTVESRSKRARLYDSVEAAKAVQTQFPDTELWPSQGVLPADRWVLVPKTKNGRRLAFTTQYERVVTHGGVSLDEVVVPLVTIKNN